MLCQIKKESMSFTMPNWYSISIIYGNNQHSAIESCDQLAVTIDLVALSKYLQKKPKTEKRKT